MDFFNPALSLEREEGINRKYRENGKLVKDVLKCLNNSDIFDTMSVMMQQPNHRRGLV